MPTRKLPPLPLKEVSHEHCYRRYRNDGFLRLVRGDDRYASRQAATHPGEILLEEWLRPLDISQYALAKAIGVPPRRINEIVHGKRGITIDTALRLAAFFGTDAHSWVNLQTHYDTEMSREAMRSTLAHIRRFAPVRDRLADAQLAA